MDCFRVRAEVPNGARVVRGVWSHLVADSTDELMHLADLIGLRPEWIQDPGTWGEHFDVTEPKRRAAIAVGAVELTVQQMGTWLNDKRSRLDTPAVAIPPSRCCTWCGHEPHQVQCLRQLLLQTKPPVMGRCRCARQHYLGKGQPS